MSAYVAVHARAASVGEVADFARLATALGVADDQTFAIAAGSEMKVVVPHDQLLERLAPAAVDGVDGVAGADVLPDWKFTPLDDALALILFEHGEYGTRLVCERCKAVGNPCEVVRSFEGDFATALAAVLGHLQSAGHTQAERGMVSS